jgi:hypothetical protein
MKIEYTPVRELRFYPNNARTHSKKQIRQIANSIDGAGNFSGPSREFGLYPGLHPEGVNREMLVPTLAAQCGCSGIFFGGAPHRARTVSMLAETLPGRPPTAFLDDGWRRGGGSLPIRVSCACARDPGNCRRQAGPGPFPRAREGCTLG